MHSEALANYRQVVEALGEFVHQVPRVVCNDIFARTQGAASKAAAGVRDSFARIYAQSQARA